MGRHNEEKVMVMASAQSHVDGVAKSYDTFDSLKIQRLKIVILFDTYSINQATLDQLELDKPSNEIVRNMFHKVNKFSSKL